MYSKYERRTDTRTYEDRKTLYEGVSIILINWYNELKLFESAINVSFIPFLDFGHFWQWSYKNREKTLQGKIGKTKKKERKSRNKSD